MKKEKMSIEEARLIANEAYKLFCDNEELEVIEVLSDYVDELEEKIEKMKKKLDKW